MENIFERENSLFTFIKSCEKFSYVSGMIIIGEMVFYKVMQYIWKILMYH